MNSEQKAQALAQFIDYFVRNYPGPDTIIFDPTWHAPKIFAAAYSAITASLSEKQAVEVKALEWDKKLGTYRGSERREQWRAKTPWGDFVIWHYQMIDDEAKRGPKFTVGSHMTPFPVMDVEFDTLDEAKAAAQADYEQRIRSALVDVPAVEAVEPDWWLVTTDMGKVIFHGPDKDRAERVAAMRGRPVTPLYAAPYSRNALDKERGE